MPEAKCREQSTATPTTHQRAGETASEGETDSCRRSRTRAVRPAPHCSFKFLMFVCVKDLSELQKERQCLERQHQQEVNKLNQELQQARTLHNALQAQADKVDTHRGNIHVHITRPSSPLKCILLHFSR